MMLHLILLFSLCCQFVYSQTDCQFFRPATNNYTAWSESHIATWCKHHDPSSTSQCATVSWPESIPSLRRVNHRRNPLEFILRLKPRIGTRKDCIARSSALSLTYGKNANGLYEAATCDLYYFDYTRSAECVCFPVYDDHVSHTTYIDHDIYDITSVFATTSVFYPPEQVVSSYLLAAATQGTPTTCNPKRTTCPKSANLVHRKPRVLGDFPYCPRPGQQQKIPTRTYYHDDMPSKPSKPCKSSKSHKSHKSHKTHSPKPWALLPNSHACKSKDTKEQKSQCKIDKCMWSFVRPYMSPTVAARAVTNAKGAKLFVTSVTDYVNITTPHWGFLAHPSSITQPCSTSLSSKDRKKKEKDAKIVSKPLCRNANECRAWCEKRVKAPFKHMMVLLAGFTAVSALASLAMLARLCFRRRRNKARAEDNNQVVQGVELVQIPSAAAGERAGDPGGQGGQGGQGAEMNSLGNGPRTVRGQEIVQAPSTARGQDIAMGSSIARDQGLGPGPSTARSQEVVQAPLTVSGQQVSQGPSTGTRERVRYQSGELDEVDHLGNSPRVVRDQSLH
ncbi:hypothetical protein AUEXF2481DRAFT_24640 [Aureobasidium subglaciale EXF-2481]|uniref:Uncharacterized protein n=1 Tax=Aureobasidium subglaciale (strain EXF-2481) TaxID=1043005 RepID=A0A074YRA9_AURSE|nr:uncharacterized protein AUEXF2481DRAFT_24640 [Aureobasidium subglaciale EXF-2481]KAI5212212.1 hypothetical protein E4T38_00683 [Aureobasidium subglaciale]KAI5231211.1 hypothetical protein E4T40_00684 [Aureobasidium subglaciale]KAI5234031.1 hypothetical protein E4T41_00682 [Aureobasidium subglaciale]KAI5267615.1 hypothetical protein E4T46_00682 [Aureobasidium subglaciale]KER00299.1 hypothetical protein AUEXF2481DRAFT_24640 [Aureobasidium subglaciale EXF-2481]